MVRQTIEQIRAEIDALKELKPKVRHYTAFGDDNHAMMDVEIGILERAVAGDAPDEDEIHRKYDDDPDLCSSAEYVLEWLEGTARSGSMSESWKPLSEDAS